MAPELIDYCCGQDGLVLIPIEALSPEGMDAGFAAALVDRGALTPAAAAGIDRAFTAYWQRCARLNERAPRYWFPPRLQHLCLVTRPVHVRPYFQPLRRSSWLLYAGDFEPETSTTELAVFLLLLVERMGLLEQVVPALTANLSYLLTLSPEQRAELAAGCRRSRRPDASGYQALARALPGITRLHHVDLRPPPPDLGPARQMPHTGLILTAEAPARLDALERAWARAAHQAFDRHRQRHARPAPRGAARIADWLAETRPRLLVTAGEDRLLWDPEKPRETAALREALAEVGEVATDSILADLAVVDRHSQRFLDSLTEPEGLVDPAPYITASGLSYIHKARKRIAYDLGPGENEARLWQPAPPFERWMLGARTVHEWGHLAAESGWVHVPEARRAEREGLELELAGLLEAVCVEAPAAVRARAARELDELRAKGEIGQVLRQRMLLRIEDFMSNLLARRFLHPDEMDTYVRNNVSSHVQDYSDEAIFQQLTRYAYEFQYLRLARIEDPLAWFYDSTWFRERFVAPGIVGPARFEQLLETIGRICDCYAIDETKFDFAKLPPAPAPPG